MAFQINDRYVRLGLLSFLLMLFNGLYSPMAAQESEGVRIGELGLEKAFVIVISQQPDRDLFPLKSYANQETASFLWFDAGLHTPASVCTAVNQLLNDRNVISKQQFPPQLQPESKAMARSRNGHHQEPEHSTWH